ncbi:olfactory receptor 4F17-like [Tachyglossus aculeatus]|uniref:olfactory receptor 4F17-like n=1 Tax=Tachyglossus aculeatus TaxID=9261 RepID=UPI0018F3C7B2|nr:olfactory receptor 4F17-like [Tachyglossus aculeatus]
MGWDNRSMVTEFVLLGLSDYWAMQCLLCVLFSVFYVAIVLGNTLIVLTVVADPHLHSPMYFLLAHLSFIDFCISSIATPNLIYDALRETEVISVGGCFTQMFFIHFVGGSEMVLLVAMAYDRYVAICRPLHYMATVTLPLCAWLVAAAWAIGLIHSVSQLVFVVDLPFCGPNEVGSFYCDFPRVIQLACTDTYRLEFVVTANSGLISMGTFILLIFSYIFMLVSVRQRSSIGLSKAFSTLSAHISVVVLFFGPCIFVYIWPFPKLAVDKYLAIFDAVITPFLNPLIYTFRNKDMKMAVVRLTLRSLHRKNWSEGSTEQGRIWGLLMQAWHGGRLQLLASWLGSIGNCGTRFGMSEMFRASAPHPGCAELAECSRISALQQKQRLPELLELCTRAPGAVHQS